MNSFSSSDTVSFSESEKTLEVLQSLYGSATQPPLLTNILSLLLEHAFTALCLTKDDNALPCKWSVSEEVEVLTKGMQDPIINAILAQDVSLRTFWQAILAFAYRCEDAYQQGRRNARIAFPHFPRHRFNALQQEHLASLLSDWHYNPHAATTQAKHTYPGYTPEAEQTVLLRWFQRGYLFGSQEESEKSTPKTVTTRWSPRS